PVTRNFGEPGAHGSDERRADPKAPARFVLGRDPLTHREVLSARGAQRPESGPGSRELPCPLSVDRPSRTGEGYFFDVEPVDDVVHEPAALPQYSCSIVTKVL